MDMILALVDAGAADALDELAALGIVTVDTNGDGERTYTLAAVADTVAVA